MSLPIEIKKTKEPEAPVTDSFEPGSPRTSLRDSIEDRYKSSVTFTDPPGKTPKTPSLDDYPRIAAFLKKHADQSGTKS